MEQDGGGVSSSSSWSCSPPFPYFLAFSFSLFFPFFSSSYSNFLFLLDFSFSALLSSKRCIFLFFRGGNEDVISANVYIFKDPLFRFQRSMGFSGGLSPWSSYDPTLSFTNRVTPDSNGQCFSPFCLIFAYLFACLGLFSLQRLKWLFFTAIGFGRETPVLGVVSLSSSLENWTKLVIYILYLSVYYVLVMPSFFSPINTKWKKINGGGSMPISDSLIKAIVCIVTEFRSETKIIDESLWQHPQLS